MSEPAVPLRLGISRCLLGDPVRYDGGHKLDHYLRDTLGHYVEYVPVCPEVECGLPVPREAMRLVGDPEEPRLVTRKSGQDLTSRMLAWAQNRVAALETEGLCGFVFKSRSPSSGMARVKVYSPAGMPSATGVGLFARAFMERFPHLPVEEEGRLHDPELRENFIERLFVMQRWQALCVAGGGRGPLVAFHTRHKLLVMAHSPQHYRELGRLVAAAHSLPEDQLYATYLRQLTTALGRKATPAKHVNVLQHIMGYFKKQLTADEKQELLEGFDAYRQALVPLIVPITLMNHYVRRFEQPYLAEQVYLHPHPAELRLRNHC